MRENEARRQSETEINRMWDNLLKKQDEAFVSLVRITYNLK